MSTDTDTSSVSGNHLVYAYYVTGHGFGHATRVVEVVRHLINAGHDVHVVAGAPDFVFTSEIQSPRLFIRKVVLDCGVVKVDALTVDRLASLEKYSEMAVLPRESILKTEVEWLKSISADLVVSDVVPVACRAAAEAGIRSVCVTNFSWDFIYAEYVMVAGSQYGETVWQIAEDYSHCEFLIRLPGYCPMPAFHDVIDVPWVVRRPRKTRQEVRRELGIEENAKVVILNFGGQPSGLKLKEEFLPPGWVCLVCGASKSKELPPNFINLAKDAYTPDLIAASDCMLGKISYGTCSEALAYKLPFVFVRRDYFNEEPFLRHMLEYHQTGVEMVRRDLLTGRWKPYLDHAIRLSPSYEGAINGGEVAAKILQDTACGKIHASSSSKLSGARRLRDAIVLGVQLQRVPGRDIFIPDWYVNAEHELGQRGADESTQLQRNERASQMGLGQEDFEILHGDVYVHGLPDTIQFLKCLASLDIEYESETSEKKAAAEIFNWEEDIFVTRAPGRLDVMGGIADYSGSLVLQMPIKEACHVAIQRNRPSRHRLWDRALARQQARGNGPTPVLQIVSYGSELSNRGPTFDMDLSDFMDGDDPISYDKARDYFSRDPSQKWAAYAAGAVLVLMTELGTRFDDSISMLVSSAVPEGKGVSSSASVEVACMSAIAAAQGLDIPPRELALLCQKVENHIVGAPCGVMDQMASACGEANKLLAMVCQPAEVLGLVDLPNHIRFWGIDSGIRHSVGGADYGSVRVGAFMGRKIIRSIASAKLSPPTLNREEDNDEDRIEHEEASLDYLCNMHPHRYEGVYANLLPESILGETFLEQYKDHNDPVTAIDPKHIYGVRASTRHPIYENFRVAAFKALLTSASSKEQLSSLGQLLYQCHYSYSTCGLGSHGTDKLVELVQEMQHKSLLSSSEEEKDGTLFGAKITGGGSGGTICVLGRNCLRSNQQILEIQHKYEKATGYLPFVFEGSSPGAGKFGYLRIRRRASPTAT